MRRKLRSSVWALMGLLFALAVPACSMTETRELPEPRSGVVSDLAAFEAFIAQAPRPEAFREVYPDVMLILPGEVATREFRTDNSRFFADLDAEERIIGGSFQ
ncbi:hypothetical protein [Thioalkalivibrio sp.]|uniref:hypothetical protein n=1 Tax=Thioalkalivibrio sp. TaxID=2093813 RepID=UPI003974D48E